MNTREQLVERRLRLVMQSGQLRDTLSTRAQAAAPWFARAEQARRAGRWLVDHPVVPVTLAVLLLWRRTRWVLRWAPRAYRWWRLWREWVPAR